MKQNVNKIFKCSRMKLFWGSKSRNIVFANKSLFWAFYGTHSHGWLMLVYVTKYVTSDINSNPILDYIYLVTIFKVKYSIFNLPNNISIYSVYDLQNMFFNQVNLTR